jgi:hypothetical protein
MMTEPIAANAIGLGATVFTLALLLDAMMYSSASCLLLILGLIPFSAAAVYLIQILILPRIAASARKVAAQSRETMKPSVVFGFDGI